jgi:hypothetical protein
MSTANIIDEFFVSLGLDPSGFNAGRKQVQDASKKLRDDIVADNARQTVATKSFQDSLRGVKTEVLGLALAIGGAASVKGFITNILDGDAATGRLANNLGIATDKLSAWEQAVQRVGGSKGDIDASLSSLSNIFQNYQLRGDLSKNGDLAGLGLSPADLNDPTEAMLKLADASKRFSPREFNSRVSALGIDQNTINLLEKGRGAVEAYLEEARKNGAVTERDAKAAQELQSALAKLKAEIEGGARPAVTGLANGLVAFLTGAEKLHAIEPAIVGTLAAVAAATLAATWEWVALAAAVSAVYALYKASPAERGKIIEDIRTGQWRKAFGSGLGASNDSEGESRVTGKPGGWIANQQASVGRYVSNSGDAAYLQKQGLTSEQARGAVAGIHAEGGGLGFSANGAFGLGQWRGPRLRELFRRYGRNPTRQQQLEYLAWELNGGDQGGAAVKRATTADGALLAYVNAFMRPGPGTAGDIRRGRAFLGGTPGMMRGAASQSSSTTIGTIVINTAATDARGIARELPAAIKSRTVINQMQTGVQP